MLAFAAVLRNSKRVPRVAPLDPPYPVESADVLGRLGPPIALFRVFARRPQRAEGILGWGRYYLSRECALSLRHRELVIDRTTARCGAQYEWGVHITGFAAKAGLTDAQVTSLATGSPDDSMWSADDAAVIRAVDALHESSDLGDEEWTALVGAVGEEGAVDVLLLCGWYHAISFAVRALRLPAEPGTEEAAALVS